MKDLPAAPYSAISLDDDGFTSTNQSALSGHVRTANVSVSDDESAQLRDVTLAIYVITSAVGIFGNTLTIIVILMERKLKSVATCFILNLAVADEMFMLMLPFQAHSTYTQQWIYGSVLCKVMTTFRYVNGYASIFTMVLMSIDRYLAIVHPLRSMRYRTVRNALVVCALVWVACGAIMTPNWLYADATSAPFHSNRTVMKCQMNWPKDDRRALCFWRNFDLIVGFALPVLVMVVCYLRLLVCLARSGATLRRENSPSRPIRKVTTMVITVTAVFVICWTPYHVLTYISMLIAMSLPMPSGVTGPRSGLPRVPTIDDNVLRMLRLANIVAQGLVYVSSCCNPFIYCISSRNFSRCQIHTSGCLSVCWSVCLSVCADGWVAVSVCCYVHQSLSPSIHSIRHVQLSLSVHLSQPSVCLSLCMSFSACFHLWF